MGEKIMVLKLKSLLILFVKGVLIGGSMTVPGVSGGSMAMCFGIYDRLIFYTANFFKQKIKSIVYLSSVALGGIIGIIVLSRFVMGAIVREPQVTSYFFLGAIAGGIPVITKKLEFKCNLKTFVPVFLGGLALSLISLIPYGFLSSGAIGIIIAGILSAVAVILPGLSLSFVLYVCGVYNKLLLAVNGWDFAVLGPYLLSLIISLAAFTKLMDFCLRRYYNNTMLVVLGFTLMSVVEIFPGLPQNLDIIASVISLIAGFYFIFLLSSIGKCEI